MTQSGTCQHSFQNESLQKRIVKDVTTKTCEQIFYAPPKYFWELPSARKIRTRILKSNFPTIKKMRFLVCNWEM